MRSILRLPCKSITSRICSKIPSRQFRRSSGVEPRLLQGTSEKIHFQSLLGQKLLQAMDFLAVSRGVCAGREASCPGSTISSFLRHLYKHLVVPRVLALAHRHLRKSPSVRQPFAEISGVSLSLHLCFLSGDCAQFCVPLQGFTPVGLRRRRLWTGTGSAQSRKLRPSETRIFNLVEGRFCSSAVES